MRMLGIVLAAGAAVTSAAAQSNRAGDSLLATGKLSAAESAYYAVVQVRPRDPQARRQLGRFLAQRGAVRVGAVLLEEARQFGADPATIARDLIPLYRALGDYRALSTLPSSPLSDGERAQAVWLVAHPPSLDAAAGAPASGGGGDSLVVVYKPAADPSILGTIVLTVNGRAIEARIDPSRRGIFIDPRAGPAQRLRQFAARAGGAIPAVADSVQIGTLKMVNVPVFLTTLPERVDALIGIDELQRFAPSFEPRTNRLTLRLAGSVPMTTPGIRVPTLTTVADVQVLQAGRLVPISTPAFAELLRTKRWTFDARRGAIVFE